MCIRLAFAFIFICCKEGGGDKKNSMTWRNGVACGMYSNIKSKNCVYKWPRCNPDHIFVPTCMKFCPVTNIFFLSVALNRNIKLGNGKLAVTFNFCYCCWNIYIIRLTSCETKTNQGIIEAENLSRLTYCAAACFAADGKQWLCFNIEHFSIRFHVWELTEWKSWLDSKCDT